ASVQPPAPVQPAASIQPPAPVPAPTPVENIQIISPPPVQYVLPERPAQPVQGCAASPLCVAILVLLIVAVLLLAIILALILRHPRLPLWAWFYPSWVRHRLHYRKTRRD
ncbi:MAG: hypothetical protein LBF74_03410, partial [Treponema sp.]|nr:hypothetical protein [Treponema sp.]